MDIIPDESKSYGVRDLSLDVLASWYVYAHSGPLLVEPGGFVDVAMVVPPAALPGRLIVQDGDGAVEVVRDGDGNYRGDAGRPAP